MDLNYWQTWGAPYMISNAVALLLLFLSWKRIPWARYLYALMFLAASWVNTRMALNNPMDYTNYAQWAWGPYREFIQDPFLMWIQPMVLAIAFGQFLIGLGFLSSKRWLKLACVGAIIFFVAIIPLGLGSAFPFSIFAGLGCFLLYQAASDENATEKESQSMSTAREV